jgi:hypothetical protein
MAELNQEQQGRARVLAGEVGDLPVDIAEALKAAATLLEFDQKYHGTIPCPSTLAPVVNDYVEVITFVQAVFEHKNG